ncbi:MAG: HypC/HybG/HupF family hydrogenase formation chaperone [Desulfurococcaceae archaeon]
MCLGVPAEVLEVREEGVLRVAKVRMGGVIAEVLLGWLDVSPGDYVIVHAGVAISKIDESELKDYLELYEELLRELEGQGG